MVYLLFICIEYLQEIYTYLGLGSWYLAHPQILLTEVSKVGASKQCNVHNICKFLSYLHVVTATSTYFVTVQCVVVMSSVVVVTVKLSCVVQLIGSVRVLYCFTTLGIYFRLKLN